MFTYHYCAMLQMENGSLNYYDGIANTKDKIKSLEGYMSLKKIISKDHHLRITITSLSLI